MDLGEGLNLVRGGCVRATTTTPPTNPNPCPQPVMEAPEQPKVTAIRKTAKPKKPEPKKSTAATKPAAEKVKKKAATSVKTAATKPPTLDLVVPTQIPTSPLEEISDLLYHLHLQACVELTRQLFTSISSLPAGCLEDHYSLRGRICQHSLGGQNGVKPCASPAGMQTECAAGSSNRSIFSASMVSIFVS